LLCGREIHGGYPKPAATITEDVGAAIAPSQRSLRFDILILFQSQNGCGQPFGLDRAISPFAQGSLSASCAQATLLSCKTCAGSFRTSADATIRRHYASFATMQLYSIGAI